MIIYKEVQRFTQWWIWLVLIGVALIPIWGIYVRLFFGKDFGSKPTSLMVLIVFAILALGIMAFFQLMRLHTEMDEKEIRIRFVPFASRTIKWGEVETAKIISYGFVGGWGVRIGTSYGTVYNMGGKRGLAIELKNGKKLLIGTQNESELVDVLKKIQRNYPELKP